MKNSPWISRLAAACLFGLSALGALPAQAQLTLDQAIETALAQRAELRAADAAIEARSGASLQAAVRPNPIISFQSENWRSAGMSGFSPSTDVDWFAYVSQTIETAGKRRLRQQGAEIDARAAGLQREASALRIRQQVRRAYWNALGAERILALLRESEQTYQRLAEYNKVRVELGAAAEVDWIKMRVESERAQLQSRAARLSADRARIALAAAIGSPLAAEVRLVEPAERTPSSPPVAAGYTGQLLAMALEQRPAVRLAALQVESAEALVARERSNRHPNLVPYFGYKRTGGLNTMIGGVSVPLPAFDRNRGRIAEVSAELERSRAQLAVVEAEVSAQIMSAAASLSQRTEMLAAVNDGMLQQATETAQISLAAYREGGVGLLDALDASRTLNEVQRLQEQAYLDLRMAVLDLEEAVGADPLPQLPAQQRVSN